MKNETLELLRLLTVQRTTMNRIPATYAELLQKLPNPADLDPENPEDRRKAFDSLTFALDEVAQVAEDYAECARRTRDFVESALPKREDL